MSPATARRIRQEIEFQRGILTAEEQWARVQAIGDQRKETFRRINWWRARLKDAEQQLERLDQPGQEQPIAHAS